MLRFGEHVKAAKEAKGLTLDTIAKACGTHKGYVSGIIKGVVRPPAPKILKKLCRRLGLNASNMLALAWWEKRPRGLTASAAFSVIDQAIIEEQKADAKEPPIDMGTTGC